MTSFYLISVAPRSTPRDFTIAVRNRQLRAYIIFDIYKILYMKACCSAAEEDKVYQWSWPHHYSWRSTVPISILLVSLLLSGCAAATTPAKKEAPATPTPS